MSALFEENFENYGVGSEGRSRIFEGVWSQVAGATTNNALVVPSFDPQGRPWLQRVGAISGSLRTAVANDISAIGFFVQYYKPNLPGSSTTHDPFQIRDGGGNLVADIFVTATGRLAVFNSSSVQVAISSEPVILPGTLHKIQAQIVFDAAVGTVEVRVDDVTVINATGLALPGPASLFCLGGSANTDDYYVKSIAVYSLTGTYNDDWPNIDGVINLYPRADTTDDGFTPRPRQLFGEGVLSVGASGDALDCGTSADFDFIGGDYTLESWVRFRALPTSSTFATIFARWAEASGNRSYRLRYNAANVEDGGLQFEVSTDGNNRTIVHDVQWTPKVGRWYHIAVTRASDVSRIFIDGQQQGLPVSDTADYFVATAKFAVGGQMTGTGTTVFSNSSFDGFFDEVRITNGVARYVADFTPPAGPFPRGVGDAFFSDVVLLCGFDNDLVDESLFAHTLFARGNAARITPDDAGAGYRTINAVSPLDDRFLEGAFLPASGVLTLTDLPANGETVTLGAQTYTFVNSLVAANNVLIGADEAATIVNLTNAIIGGDGEGSTYGTGTTPNVSALAVAGVPTTPQMTATALTPGTAGNSIATTETLAEGAWSGSTLAGGTDLPDPSAFLITPCPPFVTGVRWLGIRNRSAALNGAASIQVSLDVNGDDALGAVSALGGSFSYRTDRFEEDPSTLAALTPTSILNARVAIDRTA